MKQAAIFWPSGNQTSVNKKVGEPCIRLAGVWAQRCIADEFPALVLPTSQPASPWQTSLCMTHRMEHVILFLMHAHTHTAPFICQGGFPPQYCTPQHTDSPGRKKQKRETLHLCLRGCVFFILAFLLKMFAFVAG